MLTIGLTGGIASGKSTVSQEFEKLGAVIIDADQIAKELTRPHTPLWRRIIGYYGKEIQREDATIDRSKLGEKIFADETERATLNRMIHPEIKREIDRRCEEIGKERPGAMIFVDAALLIETGTFREMEKIIVVSASKENQIRRLMTRDGLTRETAKRRIRTQMPLEEKRKYADYVIDTDVSVEETRKQVGKIYGELMAIRKRGRISSTRSLPTSRNEGKERIKEQ
jgi:dephospho-CoA kinase